MRKKGRILALGLLVCLNAALLGVALHLSWAFYKDTPDTRTLAFFDRQAQIERGLKELAFFYKEYELHPDVSMRQARSWMQKYRILYASLYNGHGNLLFRYYHRQEIPFLLLEQIKRNFGRQDDKTSFLPWHGQRLVLERRRISVTNSHGTTEVLPLEYAWKSPGLPALSFYYQFFLASRDFLDEAFGVVALWVALLLCLTGLALLALSLRALGRTLFAIEELETPNASAASEKGAQLFRMHTEEPLLFTKPKQDADAGGVVGHRLADIPAHQRARLENFLQKRLGSAEQLRWDLSGFQSIEPLPEVSPDELLAEDYAKEAHGSLLPFLRYDFRYAEHLFGKEGVGSIGSLSAWARTLLEKASGIEEQAVFTLYLRNRFGKLQTFLQKRGSLYISGEALPCLSDSNLLSEVLDRGGCLIEKTAGRLWIAIQDKGLVCCEGGRNLGHSALLEGLQQLGEDFGSLLLHLQAFESAVCDPQSSFYNGLMLQRDMQREFLLFQRRQIRRRLLLLYAGGDGNGAPAFSDNVVYFSKNLREFMGEGFSFYRIGRDLLALLGDPFSKEEERSFLQGLEMLAARGLLPPFRVSWAEPESRTESVALWFDLAWQNLLLPKEEADLGRWRHPRYGRL